MLLQKDRKRSWKLREEVNDEPSKKQQQHQQQK